MEAEEWKAQTALKQFQTVHGGGEGEGDGRGEGGNN